MINYSEIESKRFGIRVFRGKTEEVDIEQLGKEIEENEVDVLILRIPTSLKSKQHKLLKLGYEVLHADSLVYYSCDLEKVNIHELKNDLIFEPVDGNNAHVLDEIIPIIFDGYQNHYYSNPIFDHVKINEGYIEWAKSYGNDVEGRVAWLIKDAKSMEILGLGTCSFDVGGTTCEIILNGVMPHRSGNGIYSDFVRHVQSFFKSKGYTTLLISTQLQNYAVQKVWVREGFFLSHAFDTYHINRIR